MRAPFSTFQGSGVDSLNLATDNILINIPVRSKNEIIPFSFSLVGNSSARVPNAPQLNNWQVSNGISRTSRWHTGHADNSLHGSSELSGSKR